jgi:DNA polymerase III alpha subunit
MNSTSIYAYEDASECVFRIEISIAENMSMRYLPATSSPMRAWMTKRRCSALTEGKDIVADYNSMSLTLGRHPLSLLRPALLEQRLVPAATLMTHRNGWLARGCGLVTVR